MNNEFTNDELSKISDALGITLNHFTDFYPIDEDWYTKTEQQMDRQDYKELYNKVNQIIKNRRKIND